MMVEMTYDVENAVGTVTSQLEAAGTTLQFIYFQLSKDWKGHRKKSGV